MVAPPAVVGNYSSALRMEQISHIVVNSLNRIMYPDFAGRAKNGVHSLMPLAVRYGIGVTAVAFVSEYWRLSCCACDTVADWRIYRDVVFYLKSYVG